MRRVSVLIAVIIGLSFGGRVAIDFALEHPEKVAAVVAVGPGLGGYRFDSDEVLRDRKELIDAWGNAEWDRVVELFQRSWTDGPHRAPNILGTWYLGVRPGVLSRRSGPVRDSRTKA